MIGQRGVMIEGAAPNGRVRITGVIWNASSLAR